MILQDIIYCYVTINIYCRCSLLTLMIIEWEWSCAPHCCVCMPTTSTYKDIGVCQGPANLQVGLTIKLIETHLIMIKIISMGSQSSWQVGHRESQWSQWKVCPGVQGQLQWLCTMPHWLSTQAFCDKGEKWRESLWWKMVACHQIPMYL